MHIRPFTPDDWQSICDIHDRCKPDEMRGAVDPSVIVPIQHDSRTQDLYRESALAVAEEAGRVVGFIGTLGAYVSALFVDPSQRRRGVGAALMQSVLDAADGPICLNVGKHNTAAPYGCTSGLASHPTSNSSASSMGTTSMFCGCSMRHRGIGPNLDVLFGARTAAWSASYRNSPNPIPRPKVEHSGTAAILRPVRKLV
jgi:GNAT superfamily N-acetyltransferase